jgi:hypothetical protein
MDEMMYENLIRWAFTLSEGGSFIGRHEDPAMLANTDYFTQNNIDKAKSGLTYAMNVFISTIINSVSWNDTEYNRICNFPSRVLAADTISDIGVIMREFEHTVIDTYFTRENGEIYLN